MQIQSGESGFPVYSGFKANMCSFDVNIKKRKTFVFLFSKVNMGIDKGNRVWSGIHLHQLWD